MKDLVFKNISESDYPHIIPMVNEWWGGRNMSPMLPRLFFQHFQDTSFVTTTVGEKPRIVGFLVGFVSQTNPDVGYIHFVGVDPGYRKSGIGEALYSHFFDEVRRRGCHKVSCVTSPVNKTSIAFHQRMGFSIQPGDSSSEEGIPMTLDYDGPGEPRVKFTKRI